MKAVVTSILWLALLSLGVTAPAHDAFGHQPDSLGGEAAASTNNAKAATTANHPRVDLYGDALQEGAIARLGTIRFRQFNIEAMGLSTDGRVLITKSYCGDKVCAWEADTGKLLWQRTPSVLKTNPGNGLLAVSFSPDGRFVAEICDCRPASGMAECIFLCDLKDGKELYRLPTNGVSFKGVWESVFSPDSKFVAANIDGTIYRWSTESGKLVDQSAGAVLERAIIRFSADGKTIIAVSEGEKISHWDLTKRAVTRAFDLKKAYWQALSDDGQLLAVACGQLGTAPPFGQVRTATLQLFDTTTGKERCTLQGDTTGIESLAISRNGNTLIGVAADGPIRANISVWDTRNGAMRRCFPVSLGICFHVGVTPDGAKVFTSISSNHGWLTHGPGEAVVRWWDTATGKELRTKPAHTDRVEALRFTPDGRFLLSAANDSSVRIWDIATSQTLHRISEQYASSLKIVSAEGTFLSSGNHDKLNLYGWKTGQLLHSFDSPPEPKDTPEFIKGFNYIEAIAVSPDGREVTVHRARYNIGSEEHFLDIWDLEKQRIRKTVTLPPRLLFDRFQPDGKHFIAIRVSEDREKSDLVVADIESGRIEMTIAHLDDREMRWAIAPDGRTLVMAITDAKKSDENGTATTQCTLHVLDLSSGKELRTINVKQRDPENGCDGVWIAPDCRTTVTASQQGTLRFWDMSTGEEVMHSLNAPGQVLSLAFSPDGKLLATGHWDSTILLWDLSSIAIQASTHGHAQ